MKKTRRSRFPNRFQRSQPVRRSASRKQPGVDYNRLEARQMLATDLGLNLTGSTFGTQSSVQNPNMVGDVGTTHAIELIRDKISVFNKQSGVRELYRTQTQFWIEIGATVGADTITNAQVVYDRFANRWMLLGEGAGPGNWLYLAISNGPNPSNTATGWKALRFVGDSVGVRHCGDLTIGIDADALLITTRNTSNVTGFTTPSISVFTIPKVDLYAANPTVTNMSRFESLPRAQYGDYVRAASSFEASDGRATFVGNLSNGAETTRFDVVGVGVAGATITMPQKIMFNFDPFNPTLNLGSAALGWGPAPDARQVSDTDITINVDPPFIFSNAVDVNGSLWLAQSVLVPYTAGEAAGIVYYEVTKSGYDSLGPTPDFGGPPTISLPANTRIHAGVLGMPAGDIRGPLPHEWDLWNPSISVNEFGVVAINYTISSEEYEVFPTAASSIGVTVNGASQYDPVFDTIFWVERNTQFEAPVFVQPGLGVYENNGVNPSTWSYRASTNFDPSNVNRFWANIQWANTVNRWSTSVAELRPNRFVVTLTANDLNNDIVVRRSASNNDLLEIEIDGVVTDRLPYEVVGRVIINGFDGADHYLLDYSNGNPVPEDGFVFDGMRGPDTVETNNPDGSRFVVDEDSAGTYNEVSRFQNVENLHGGPGNDTFTVTDNPLLGTFGFLAGSLVGNDGDDLFHFGGEGAATIGDSVLGGTGFNTLSFETRLADTEMTLLGYGGFTGYEGRTVGGPIGGDQATDRFYDINYIRGSDTSFDTVNGLDVLTNVFVDDEASIYETGGINLGFFEVNAINMSSFNDRIVGVRNTVNPLQLNGLDGDDDYYFSSDGDGLMGSTASLQGLLFAQGGAGINEMWISNRGGTANTAGLILLNRVAGIGEIAYNAIGGRFFLTVWTSEFADHVDLHSYVQTNTLELFLLGGDDRISIQDLSKAFIKVYGGVGDDVYAIEKVQGIDLRNLELIDSVNAERDRVTLVGTLLDETWIITNTTFFDLNVVYTGIELFGIEGRAGVDTFYIKSADVELFIDGEEGNDVFVFSSDAPGTTGGVNGILKRVTIEGGSGQNRLTVSARDSGSSKNTTVHSDRIEGLLPDTLFYAATGGSFSLTGQVGGIHLIGSEAGNDVFTVLGLGLLNTLRIDGVGGNDYFVVRTGALGNILLNGGNGDDRTEVSLIGSGSRQVFVNDSGVTGDDRLFVLGTAVADIFSIDPGAVRRASEAILRQSALIFASVEGLDGNDQFNVNGGVAANLHLFGGNQNDTFTVTGTSGVTGLLVSGEAGNDTLSFSAGLVTTYAQVYGGADNDNLVIGTNVLGNMLVDGGAGSDTVNTTIAASGGRFLDARDSGATIGDHLMVNGNSLSNLFVVRETQVEFGAQRTIYDPASERLTINGLDGIDLVDIHGSTAAVVRVNGGNGNDQITVVSTNLAPQITLDGQDGDDVFTIRRTLAGSRITALGNSGDDLFNVGSTATEDNGDLNTIQGIVSITAGTNGTAGQDRLYVNDKGVGAAYSYYFGPTGIRTIPGPLAVARPLFVGINYDSSLELARLDGTQFANFFSVIPSQFTTYYIDGNLPNPVVQNGDQIFLQTTPGDGHLLHITAPSLGAGYWDFTNGTKDVRFENIEMLFSKNTGAAGPLAMRSSGGYWGVAGGTGGGQSMPAPGPGGNGGGGSTSGNPIDLLMGSVARQNGTKFDQTWGWKNRFRVVAPGVADQVFNSDVRVVLGMI